jgi:hypothetical protein
MGNFMVSVPSLGNKFVDYRDRIPGDSYSWSWERPLSEPIYIAIHHTAGPSSQTPDQIASYHVNSLGWGGVGYHFIISSNGTVYYVGDLTTARANVLNMNNLVIGICLVGNFMNGAIPTENQLNTCNLLCAQLLFNTPQLSGIDGWEDVKGHKELSSTACPGDTWESWKVKIIGVTPPAEGDKRTKQISDLYRIVLGREPDQEGLNNYVNSDLTIEKIRTAMVESQEHKTLINKAKNFKEAQSLASEAQASISQAYDKIDKIIKLNQ